LSFFDYIDDWDMVDKYGIGGFLCCIFEYNDNTLDRSMYCIRIVLNIGGLIHYISQLRGILNLNTTNIFKQGILI